MVRPRLEKCLADGETEAVKQEGWLFIAWTFGRIAPFKVLAAKVLLHLKIAEDGSYVVSGSGASLSVPMPPDIIGKIAFSS